MRRFLLKACLGGPGTWIGSIGPPESVVGECGAVAVGAHGGQREAVEKCVGGDLAWRASGVIADEEFSDGGGNAGVLEDVVDDRAARDPRRDEDGGHADAEAIEGEGIGCAGGAGLGDEAVGRAGGRRDVIVDAAVLVIDDQQRRVGPELRVLADGVVDGGDELLAGANVMVGMLIVGDDFSGAIGRVVVGVVGLDEAVVGKLIAIAGVEEVLEGAEESMAGSGAG